MLNQQPGREPNTSEQLLHHTTHVRSSLFHVHTAVLLTAVTPLVQLGNINPLCCRVSEQIYCSLCLAGYTWKFSRQQEFKKSRRMLQILLKHCEVTAWLIHLPVHTVTITVTSKSNKTERLPSFLGEQPQVLLPLFRDVNEIICVTSHPCISSHWLPQTSPHKEKFKLVAADIPQERSGVNTNIFPGKAAIICPKLNHSTPDAPCPS